MARVSEGKAEMPPDTRSGRSPRVLFQDGTSAPVADKAAVVLPAVLFGAPQAPSRKGDSPRILAAGEIRHRIPCTAAALRGIDPTAAASVVAQAIRIVDGVNLDDHHFDDVVRFGSALQAAHGRLAEEELAFVESAALADGKRLGAELLQLMSDLDPEAVFAVRGGVLQTMRAFAAGHVPEQDFARLYPRIRELSQDLEVLAPEIRAVSERLRAVGNRYAALDRSLAAHSLAGRFLVASIASLQTADRERQAHYASQAEAIETRIASLEATKATIAVGRRTLDALARTIDALAWSGQDLLREDLPAWHSAYSAALMAAHGAGGGTDAVAVLRNIHARIFEKLFVKG